MIISDFKKTKHIHTQLIPSNEWIINHNMNGYPNVIVIDSTGYMVECEIIYNSENQITLLFTPNFLGMAVLHI